MIGNSITTNRAADPPTPRGYPLVGILPALMRDPLHFLTGVAQQYGDVIGLQVGPQRFYLLNHPDHFKHVLQERYGNYHKGANLAILKRLFGEGLATSEGDFWLRQRRLVQPAFHRERIAGMGTIMTDATLELLQRWQPAAMHGDSFDIVAEMMRLTQHIIVTTMFSSAIGEQAEAVYHALMVVLKHLSRGLWVSVLPDRLTPGHRRFEQALRTLDNVVYRIIEERRQRADDPGDLLTMLLQVRDSETGDGMSDKQVRDEVMTIFLAGYETSSTTLAWVWHLLAQHPDVEERLHAELATVLGGRLPTFHDLPQLIYTKQVIEETMRLYPAAWALFRTPLTDDLIGGYRIPAGSIVILSPYVLHRTSTFWEHPERFDPERFTPERCAARARYTYMPFGGGPRQCIGNAFAQMEMQLVLATIAQRYRLRSVSEHPVEPHIAVLLQPRNGIRMTPHLRSLQA